MRSLFTIVYAAMLLVAANAQAGASGPLAPSLVRENVVVQGADVRLGDLFRNAGPKASASVAQAPEPGRKTIFDSVSLASLARAHGLRWRPASRFDQVEVRRASQVIDSETIRQHLVAELESTRAGQRFEVELDRRNVAIHMTVGVTPEVAVGELQMAGRGKRFSAILVASADASAQQELRVTGRVYAVTKVPVLNESVMPGQIVTKDQVDWIQLRVSRMNKNLMTGLDQIVGQTPRRPLSPGTPIRRQDLRTPVVVAKGSLVTMRLRMPTMVLTSQGRALDNGGPGSTIRVQNTQSGHVIHAEVAGPSNVTVSYLPIAIN